MTQTHEYRVTWRRANARRLRTRRYATEAAARSFADWLAVAVHHDPYDDREIPDPHSTLGLNLAELGPAVDIQIQRRPIGTWGTIETIGDGA